MPGTDRKPFLLAHFKEINVQSCLESLEMINTLCTLYLLSKPDTIPSSMSIVQSHGKKFQNYFCATSYLTLRRNVARWDITEGSNEEKMIDFDYCQEYLGTISNKLLWWQC